MVAPAFSEKSNSLVWKESLRQGLEMANVWSKLEGNNSRMMKVEDTAPYTATLALHVISAAGFGVRQLWAGEDEKKLGSKAIPGFNTSKLTGNHTLTFKESLKILLGSIIWLAIFPVSLLRKSSENPPLPMLISLQKSRHSNCTRNCCAHTLNATNISGNYATSKASNLNLGKPRRKARWT